MEKPPHTAKVQDSGTFTELFTDAFTARADPRPHTQVALSTHAADLEVKVSDAFGV